MAALNEVDNGIVGNGFPYKYEIRRLGRDVKETLTFLAAVNRARYPGDEVHGWYRNGTDQHIGTVNLQGRLEVSPAARW